MNHFSDAWQQLEHRNDWTRGQSWNDWERFCLRDWRIIVNSFLGHIKVEIVHFSTTPKVLTVEALIILKQVTNDGHILIFVDVLNFGLHPLQNSQMSVRTVRAECVKNDSQFVSFEIILTHDLKKLVKRVFQEVELSLHWVFVQNRIAQLWKCLYDELKNAFFFCIITISWSSWSY